MASRNCRLIARPNVRLIRLIYSLTDRDLYTSLAQSIPVTPTSKGTPEHGDDEWRNASTSRASSDTAIMGASHTQSELICLEQLSQKTDSEQSTSLCLCTKSTPSISQTHILQHSATSTQPSKGPSTEHSEEAYYSIPSDPSFSLTSTQPLKLRPFKPTYHMTMALESSSIPDLIAMDTSFPARCKIRSSLISTERPEVLACTPRGTAPVLELYSWLVGTYLPARFPSVYVRSERSGVKNEVTGEEMPLSVDDGMTALEILGRNVDDEFLLMLPGEHEGDEGRYRLEAFVNCFPSGFNTRKKLGMRLNEIHGPVPGYKAK